MPVRSRAESNIRGSGFLTPTSVDAGAGRDRWLRHVVDCLSLDLCPNVRNESGDIEFRIDTLDLFADDQAVLCQIEKCTLLSHVQEVPIC